MSGLLEPVLLRFVGKSIIPGENTYGLWCEFPGKDVDMNLFNRAAYVHRVWRQRLRGDKYGLGYLLSRDLRGKTAVDIGANRGVYSYWLNRQVGPTGHVIAFEPQPELGDYLRDVKSSFHLDRVEIVNCGLSSSAGTLPLIRPRYHWGGASFEGTPDEVVDRFDVPVTTLDEFLEAHPARPVSFIKCDVELHEPHVFRGAESILTHDRPEILVEVFDAGDPECETIRVLEGFGYVGYCFQTDGYVPVAEYNRVKDTLPKKARRDFAFVPEEIAGRMPLSRAA